MSSAALADPVDDALRGSAPTSSTRRSAIEELAQSGHPTPKRCSRLSPPVVCSFTRPTGRSLRDSEGKLRAARTGEPTADAAVAQAGPRQQQGAPCRRGGPRLLDPPGTGSGEAPPRRSRGSEIPRRNASFPSSSRPRPRVGHAPARNWAGPRRHRPAEGRCAGGRASPPSSAHARGDQEAAALLLGPADAPEALRTVAASGVGPSNKARALGLRAGHRLRRQPRLGPAPRRRRPCHHVRPDGRDQHGPWRDGHARRLYDLRGAGGDPRPRAGSVRGLPLHRHPAGFLVAGAVGVAIERSIIRFFYAARWRRSSPPGACRSSSSRRCAASSARRTGSRRAALDGRRPRNRRSSLTYNRVAIVVFACAVFAALLLVLSRTPLGLQIAP